MSFCTVDLRKIVRVDMRQMMLPYLRLTATLVCLTVGNVIVQPATAQVNLSQMPVAQAPQAGTVRPYSAESAPEWDALFDRTTGWTGADGVYTLPLVGTDAEGNPVNSTLWTFNDTFVGTVNDKDDRIRSRIVRNTAALMNGNQPNSPLEFLVGQSRAGEPTALFLPNNPSERWLWPNAGIVANEKVYLFALRMKPLRRGDGDGVFDFAYEGVSLLSDQLSSAPFQNYQQVNTPLYASSTCDRGSIIFGQSLLSHADGYLYIYGVRHDLDSKKLIVARVLPEEIEDFTKYQFWDGKQWGLVMQSVAPLADQMSSEFSVTPLPDGRFMMVFQLNDYLSRTVAVRYGSSPIGPWSESIPVWNSREEDLSLHTITYGAKAHPNLSQPGELLISYATSTTKHSEQYDNADIYRPRFIRLSLADTQPANTAEEQQVIANQEKRNQAEQLLAQATQQSQAKQLPAALQIYQQALQIYQQIGDRTRASSTLHRIGNLHLELQQYPQALESFQAALEIQQDMNDRVQEGITLAGIGQVYDYQGDHAQALEFYGKSLSIRREVGDRCGEGTTMTRIGGAHANQGEYPEALQAFRLSLPIHREVANRRWEAIAWRNMGAVYVQQQELKLARDAYGEALKIYRELGDVAEEEAIRQRIAESRE
jgi:tetratricopeptide (TPR) repeat protein